MPSPQVSPHDQTTRNTSDARWLVMALGSVFGVMAIVSGLLWALGAFNFSGTEPAANVLVAALTLVGTLFGTTITVIGLMLKRSLDARNLVLKTEAEERLKLDTAIKAVELFRSASGASSPAESAGALFALTRLGQLHFALALLEQLWPKGIIETPSAAWVINSAFQSGDGGAADLASNVLRANAARLPNGRGGKHWPADYELEWPSGISFLARQQILAARIESLLSVEFGYWRRDWLNVDIVALSQCLRNETSPLIKQSAAAFLVILLQTYDPREQQMLQLPTGDLAIEELRTEIRKTYGDFFTASNEQDRELEEKLRGWITPAPYFEASASTVASA